MKAINTPATKTLRILDNIMEGNPEWFAKDEHHSASLEFARVGGEYEIITAKFYGNSAHVRKLNFTDIEDALGYLASNRYYNVANKPDEQEQLEVTSRKGDPSPIAEFIGKKLLFYESWNGSFCNITIEQVEQHDDSVIFTGANSYGEKSKIYINDYLIQELLEIGYAESHQEIDHCDVVNRWNIK